MTPSSCPDAASLQALLDGALPEERQAELSRHLETCADCRFALDKLATDGRSFTGLARELQKDATAPEPGLQRVLAEAAGAPCEETQAEPIGKRDEELAFLAPSSRAGHLGRLGHYEIQSAIGKGAFGIVLKAFDEKLHRVVAIKVLSPAIATSGTARKRFAREAQAAAAVAHEHVVTIHAVEDEANPPYLVMQCIDGMSLQEKLDKEGPLGIKEILRIGMQAAAGLAAAHKQGLVHRDVKPANILLENGVERVKITDFGMARAVDDASLTQSGVIAGTPLYMSPEQAQGEAIDHRSDLFSLGTVLYVMCTGRAPFRASGTMAVLKRVVEWTPRPIREINPDIPEWLADIIGKLHAKKPADRYQTANEVAEILNEKLAALQMHGRSGTGPIANLPSEPRPTVPRLHPRHLIAASILFLAGTAALLFWPRADPGTPDSKGRPDDEKKERPAAPAPSVVVRAKATWQGHGSDVYWITTLDDGITPVSTGYDGTAIVWGPDGKPARIFGHKKGPNMEVVVADRFRDELITTSWDGKVKFWKLADGTFLRSFNVQKGIMTALDISPDGRLLAAGGGISFDPELKERDFDVRIWDLSTGKVLHLLKGHTEHVTSAAFSPDGKFLSTTSHDRSVRIWNVATGESHRSFAENKPTQSAVWSRDGTRLASVGWEDLTIWDPLVGREVRRFPRVHGQRVTYSPDGSVLAVAAEKVIQLWDLESNRLVAILEGHTKPVLSVAFARDGKTLYSGGRDGVVKVWDVSSWTATARAGEPFIILATDKKAEARHPTLAAAVAAAQSGDTIEIRGDGPFATAPVSLDRALTLRAGEGRRPVLVHKTDGWLLQANAPLVLEGLEFRSFDNQIKANEGQWALIQVNKTPLRIAHCRVCVKGELMGIQTFVSPSVEVKNSEVLGSRWNTIDCGLTDRARIGIRNCFLGRGSAITLYEMGAPSRDTEVELIDNTCVFHESHQDGTWNHRFHQHPVDSGNEDFCSVHFKAVGNVFQSQRRFGVVIFLPFGDADRPYPPNALANWYRDHVTWEARDNLFAVQGDFLVFQGKTQEGTWKTKKDWQDFRKSEQDPGSEGTPRFIGGDLLERIGQDPLKVTPADFRLVKGSPGQGVGPGGKDLGADVDKVGPGKPYEEWKKTPEYAEWQKKTQALLDGK